LALSPGHSGGVASARRDQWDIIHGRLAPCIAVMMAALGGPPTGRVVEMGR
jgi:hypothetical protein